MQKKLDALKVQDENNRNGATRREGWGEGRRVERGWTGKGRRARGFVIYLIWEFTASPARDPRRVADGGAA